MGLEHVLPHQVEVDMGVMEVIGMKEYSTHPRAAELSHHSLASCPAYVFFFGDTGLFRYREYCKLIPTVGAA